MSVNGDIAKAVAGPVGVGLAVILVGGVIYWFASKKISQVADAVGNTLTPVNPASDKNIFYTGVNAIGTELSGNESFSLGSWFYDLTHPADANYDPNANFKSYKQRTTAIQNDVYNQTAGGNTFIQDLLNF